MAMCMPILPKYLLHQLPTLKSRSNEDDLIALRNLLQSMLIQTLTLQIYSCCNDSSLRSISRLEVIFLGLNFATSFMEFYV